MYKNTCLTPYHYEAIWLAYHQENLSVTPSFSRCYQVIRVSIYLTLETARLRLPKPQTSIDNRFKQSRATV